MGGPVCSCDVDWQKRHDCTPLVPQLSDDIRARLDTETQPLAQSPYTATIEAIEAWLTTVFRSVTW